MTRTSPSHPFPSDDSSSSSSSLALLTIFCAVSTFELHTFLGRPPGAPALSAGLASYLFPAAVALWLSADARRRAHPTPYDFGSFLFFLWPVLAPIYLFQTRGLRALGPIALFLATLLAATLFAALMSYPTASLR